MDPRNRVSNRWSFIWLVAAVSLAVVGYTLESRAFLLLAGISLASALGWFLREQRRRPGPQL